MAESVTHRAREAAPSSARPGTVARSAATPAAPVATPRSAAPVVAPGPAAAPGISAAPAAPAASGSSVEALLQLQRVAGNRTVTALPTIRRLKVGAGEGAKAPVDPATVDPATATRYLDAWAKKDLASQGVEFDRDEDALDLVVRKLSQSDVGRELTTVKQDVADYPDQLRRLRQATGAGAATDSRETKAALETLDKEKAALPGQPAAWKLHTSTGGQAGLAGLEAATTKWLRQQILVYTKARKALVTEGSASFGVPTLDRAVVDDFVALEGIKGRARKTRAPVDDVLARYGPELDAIIPGAIIVYRGSLARGVKSPTKHTVTGGGVALAAFDANYLKADPRQLDSTPSDAAYDIDANVEVPDDAFRRLRLARGPLAKSPINVPEVQKLVVLQTAIGEALRKEIPSDAGFDLSKFEFYVNSGRSAESQLGTGTPYPPHMLANAGLPAMAAQLPKQYSMELVDRVQQYFGRVLALPGEKLLLPESYWDPYFAELCDHIRTNGPLAVYLPEVQVAFEKVKGSYQAKEYTERSTPRSDVTDRRLRQPVDLVAYFGYQRVADATSAADLKRQTLWLGTVSWVGTTRNRTPMATVDFGSGITAACFRNVVLGEHGAFEVSNVDGRGPVVVPARTFRP